MSFNPLLSTSPLMLLLLGAAILITPAVNAQEIARSTVADDGSVSIYDVTRYPVVKPGQNLGISFYIGPLFWIDGRAASAASPEISGIGIQPERIIGSAQKPVVDLQKKVFICNII